MHCFQYLPDVTTSKGPLTLINKLAGKAKHFDKCVRKAEGHLKRLGDENDRERYLRYLTPCNTQWHLYNSLHYLCT